MKSYLWFARKSAPPQHWKSRNICWTQFSNLFPWAGRERDWEKRWRERCFSIGSSCPKFRKRPTLLQRKPEIGDFIAVNSSVQLGLSLMVSQRLQRCINQPRFARPHDEKPETSNEAPFSKVNPPWILNTIIVTFSAYTVLSAFKELSVHYLLGINLSVRWDGSSLSLCRATGGNQGEQELKSYCNYYPKYLKPCLTETDRREIQIKAL